MVHPSRPPARLVAVALIAWAVLVAAMAPAVRAAPIRASGPEAWHTRATVPEAAVTPAGQSSVRVLAVESFLADIAQNVAGARVKVNTLMPLGADPHTYEPAPSDVRRVADAQLLIVNGSGFEEFLDRLLSSAGGSRTVIEASRGLANRVAQPGEHGELTEAEQSQAVCTAVAAETAQASSSGKIAAAATYLPAHEGLFQVPLTPQADGTFAGYVRFQAHDGGDNYVAVSDGRIGMTDASGAEVAIESQPALACAGLARAQIVELETGDEYALALTGFKTAAARLAIGPLGGHHHHAGDPHFWLDPNLAVKYVENIRDGLSLADPDGAPVYAANAETYIAKLKELDRSIVELVAAVPPAQRLLVTDHDTFGYLADRYGFRVVGMIVPSVTTGASPSAQQVARLVQQIQAHQARAIFLEAYTNPQLAQQVAQEAKVKVVTGLYTHTLSEPGGPAADYVAMLRYDIALIAGALR